MLRKVDEYAAALDTRARAVSTAVCYRARPLPGCAGRRVSLARVLYVKRNGKKTFVITDAAMNDLIRPALYQAHHEIVPVRPQGRQAAHRRCSGAGLRVGRFLRARSQARARPPGDLVALLDAGAYGMAQSSNYNSRPRPAEVLVEGAKARLIRRRETLAELLAPEMI